jgi:hypothetical protein
MPASNADSSAESSEASFWKNVCAAAWTPYAPRPK